MAEADMAAEIVSAQARSPKLLVARARKSFRTSSGAEISAIADLSFSVKSGEYVAIVGPTGAGKSVLLDCLLGLKYLDAGQICIDGFPVENFVREKKGHITRIFQEDRLLPWLSASDNAAFGLQIQGVSQAERRKPGVRWLDAVGLSAFKDDLS